MDSRDRQMLRSSFDVLTTKWKHKGGVVKTEAFENNDHHGDDHHHYDKGMEENSHYTPNE